MTTNTVPVCQACGGSSENFSLALIYCDKCQAHAIHWYCLDVLPQTFDEYVIWFCVDCDPKPLDISAQVRGSGHASLKNNVGKKRKGLKLQKQKQKMKKKSFNSSFNEVAELVSRYTKIDEKDHRIGSQKGSNENDIDDQTESGEIKESKEAITNPSDIAESCFLAPPITYEASEFVNDFTAHVEEDQRLLRQKGSKGNDSDEETESAKRRICKEAISDSSVIMEKICACAQQVIDKEEEFVNHCARNGGKDERKVSKRNLADQETESGEIKISEEAITNPSDSSEARCVVALQTIDEGIESVRHLSRNVEKDQRLWMWKGSNGNGMDDEIESDQIKISEEVTINMRHVCAQSIMIPIWRGSLNVLNKTFGTLGEVVAVAPTLACTKVTNVGKLLPGLLSAELLPRSSLWPKRFAKWGPGGDSVSLYFFPDNERDARIYERLLAVMIHLDLGMKAIAQNVELLIFVSTLLPKFYRRSKTKYYLWGVFRRKA